MIRVNLLKGLGMHIFKVGDEVFYHSKNKAKVIKTDEPVKDDNNKPGALIEFEDTSLIPPQMAVPYHTLTHSLPSGNVNYTISSGPTDVFHDIGEDPWGSNFNKIDKEKYCPHCGKKWKETWINYKAFYDCVDCGVKKEDVNK